MSDQRFTSGPWEARSDRTVAAAGTPLLRCYAERNEQANAHLIAAAPEMYAALENLLTCFEYVEQHDSIYNKPNGKFRIVQRIKSAVGREHIASAKAALSKARGET